MTPIEIRIPGQPEGKGRARSYIKRGKAGHAKLNRHGKFVIGHKTPEKTRNYESYIGLLASLEMRGRVIFDGPVALDLQCFYEVPPSWPKWKQELALNNKIAPTVKPDADNVMKAVKDALNGIVWLDDVQVVMGVIFKAYALAPCVVAKVRPTGQLSASIKRQPTTQP